MIKPSRVLLLLVLDECRLYDGRSFELSNRWMILISGCHRVTCTSRLTWRLRRQVVWYRFRRHSWPMQRRWQQRLNFTSTKTSRQRPPRIREHRTISPRRILIPAPLRLVCVWKVSRARTATGWYTTTSSTMVAALRCWHTNDWRKLSCRPFCRPCYVATVENY